MGILLTWTGLDSWMYLKLSSQYPILGGDQDLDPPVILFDILRKIQNEITPILQCTIRYERPELSYPNSKDGVRGALG